MKLQRSGNVRVPDTNQKYKPEFQVAIIDRYHPLEKIATELEGSEEKCFSAFDGSKSGKDV